MLATSLEFMLVKRVAPDLSHRWGHACLRSEQDAWHLMSKSSAFWTLCLRELSERRAPRRDSASVFVPPAGRESRKLVCKGSIAKATQYLFGGRPLLFGRAGMSLAHRFCVYPRQRSARSVRLGTQLAASSCCWLVAIGCQMGAMVGMAVADSVGAFLEFLPVGKKAQLPNTLRAAASWAEWVGQGSRFNPDTLQARERSYFKVLQTRDSSTWKDLHILRPVSAGGGKLQQVQAKARPAGAQTGPTCISLRELCESIE